MADLEQRIRDSEEIKRLFAEGAVLSRIFVDIEVEYINLWRNSDAAAAAAREVAYYRLLVLGDVRNALLRIVTDGAMAKRQAEQQEADQYA